MWNRLVRCAYTYTSYRLLFALQLSLYLQLHLERVNLRQLRTRWFLYLCGCTRYRASEAIYVQRGRLIAGEGVSDSLFNLSLPCFGNAVTG